MTEHESLTEHPPVPAPSTPDRVITLWLASLSRFVPQPHARRSTWQAPPRT